MHVRLVHEDGLRLRHGVLGRPHLELNPPVLARVPPLGHLHLDPEGLELLHEKDVLDVLEYRYRMGNRKPYPSSSLLPSSPPSFVERD